MLINMGILTNLLSSAYASSFFGIVVIHKPYVTKSRTSSFFGLPTTFGMT